MFIRKIFATLLLAGASLFGQTIGSGVTLGSGTSVNVPIFDILYDGTNGNDSTGDGSLGAPYKTPDKARQAARALTNGNCGSVTKSPVVMGRGGYYFFPATLIFTGTTTPNDNGCVGFPTIWTSWPGEQVIWSGGTRLTGWTNESGNVWRVTLPTASYVNFEGLWYNGDRRYRPRLGASSTGNPIGKFYLVAAQDTTCTGNLPNNDCKDRYFWDPADTEIANFSNLNGPFPAGDVSIIDFEKWTATHLRLDHQNLSTHEAFFTGGAVNGPNNGFIVGHRIVYENVLDEFNVPGQWFLNRSGAGVNWTLRIRLFNGENPNNDTVIIPQIGPVVSMTGLSDVLFYDISVMHDNLVVGSTGFQSQQMDYTQQTAAWLNMNGTRIGLNHVTIAHTMAQGFWSRSDHTSTPNGNYITNSLGYDLGTGGFLDGNFPPNVSDSDANEVHDTTIYNTEVWGYGRAYPAGGGIVGLLHHGYTANHNLVHDGYATAFENCIPTSANCAGGASSTGSRDILVTYNDVYDIGQGGTNDFGCYYLATFAAPNVIVANNRCHDVSDTASSGGSEVGGVGIYVDNVTCGAQIYNNLVFRVSWALFWHSRGPAVTNCPDIWNNNIGAYPKQWVMRTPSAPPVDLQQFKFQHALILGSLLPPGSTIPGGGCGPYDPTGTPSYVDIQLWDFNKYFNLHTNLNTGNVFYTQTSIACTGKAFKTFAAWQALGEDTHSVIGNPCSVTPAYPTDDYSTCSSAGTGFVTFDTTLPGLVNPSAVPLPTTAPVRSWVSASLTPSQYGDTAGGVAGIHTSTGSLNFGNETITVPSSTQTVILTNNGTAVLNINSIVTTGDYMETNTCGSFLNVGKSCKIIITFTPTALGTRSGSVKLN